MKKIILFFTISLLLVSCEVTEPELMLSLPSNASPLSYPFILEEPADVKIDVYNSYNTFIVNLMDSFVASSGLHWVIWYYEDSNIKKIPEGVYYIELKVNNRLIEKTVISLRN